MHTKFLYIQEKNFYRWIHTYRSLLKRTKEPWGKGLNSIRIPENIYYRLSCNYCKIFLFAPYCVKSLNLILKKHIWNLEIISYRGYSSCVRPMSDHQTYILSHQLLYPFLSFYWFVKCSAHMSTSTFFVPSWKLH